MLWCLALLALSATAQGRAVNISNTWVLPEEGFPVFYRYFRDRISWYEADAVCQFHHANLVTVDTTAQYDAVRAYLKELDISSAVWVGLIRSNPDGDFTWTDYRGLSGDGYWSSAPDSRDAPLCAAADPAADYRWEARACGGPNVASFICELPVPQWALGAEGCMVRALPALTVLYLPESASVQLTADCGLAGVKRVQCNGNVKREDLLKELSCFEYSDDDSLNNSSTIWSSQSTATEAEITKEPLTTEDNTSTEHIDVESRVIMGESTMSPMIVNEVKTNYQSENKIVAVNQNENINGLHTIPLNKDINLNIMHNNNLQSNDIPKLLNDDDLFLSDKLNKLEDEQIMQHKILHDELARRGNFETIFTQPTDHFIPPLVMAKAKLNNDMTVISLEEKHAQQLAEQRVFKNNFQNVEITTKLSKVSKPVKTAEDVKPDEIINTKLNIVTDLLTSTVSTSTVEDIPNKKEVSNKISKFGSPKKYTGKSYDVKGKNGKSIESRSRKVNEKSLDSNPVQSTNTNKSVKQTQTQADNTSFEIVDDDRSIDLKVIIKEPKPTVNVIINSVIYSKNSTNDADIATFKPEIVTTTPQTLEKSTNNILQDKIEKTHEIIKITIPNDDGTTLTPTTFEFTTKIPITESSAKQSDYISNAPESPASTIDPLKKIDTTVISTITTHNNINNNEPKDDNQSVLSQTTNYPDVAASDITTSKSTILETVEKNNEKQTTEYIVEKNISSTSFPLITATNKSNTNETKIIEIERNSTLSDVTSQNNYTVVTEDMIENFTGNDEYFTETTETSETIDDFQSPLLSGANEPLPKPNRSRRPQIPPNRNKFNPFRILG